MHVLWLVNILLPEASTLLNDEASPMGGWLEGAAFNLIENKNIKLSIISPKKGVKSYKKLEGKKIDYFLFKPVDYKSKNMLYNNSLLRQIIREVKPDIVHIHGTELPHAFSMLNICEIEKVKSVISIQGLVSIYAKHITADLPNKVIYGMTLRNIVRSDHVIGLRNKFIVAGKYEIKTIKETKHIIGRTTWDKACSSQINECAVYHFCNETLRTEFYKHKWDIKKCEKHSIFLSQAGYPIKGLHYLIDAMPLILKKFPDTKVYVAGQNIIKSDRVVDRLLITYYGRYIKKLIKHYKLEEVIMFTGKLNEKQICERFLKSNVFVCPSSIENSPNSLGEAMILGMPCVASDVGGVTDMLEHKNEGFIYQSNAPYMLAYYICQLFENDELALILSKNARERALKTHNKELNSEQLLKIYCDIYNS